MLLHLVSFGNKSDTLPSIVMFQFMKRVLFNMSDVTLLEMLENSLKFHINLLRLVCTCMCSEIRVSFNG